MGRVLLWFTAVAVMIAPLSVGIPTSAIAQEPDASAMEPMATNVSFAPKKTLQVSSGAPQNPTSLDWGPDDRLYVADRLGTIRVYEVARQGSSFVTTSTQTISAVANIPNHKDNGASDSVSGRQVTGLTVAGSASNPVIYVSSSDPRIGGGTGGTNDKDIDTNSGTISRLTWTGSSWNHQILVRGLPRSEENHATNGLQYDPSGNVLYVAQGGHTNQGAPSAPFVELPEYALSAAILAVDLDELGTLPYDIPTLKNTSTPFGGQGGDNQAKWVSGGPVQVHAPGFRNAYDLVLTEAGEMYTVDNGGNQNWGDVPDNECTNATQEGGINTGDALHRVSGGYYGGHPNPTRANSAEFPGAVPSANPVECDFRNPGNPSGPKTPNPESTALVVLPNESINGLSEYTASNFDGAMIGDLLATNLVGNEVYRIQVEPGQPVSPDDVDAVFTEVGGAPLDVVAVGDDGKFPGTVWVADLGSQSGSGGSSQIVVYEPAGDFCPDGLPPDNNGDADGDGYTNADEYDNGTNPCSPASFPPDADGDGVSDLNDDDDDGDGIVDTEDPFAVDNVTPGTPATVPFRLSWDGSSDIEGGLAGTGLTGLMTNGNDYLALFGGDMTIGGAAGLLTVPAENGDALGTRNSQRYAFQLGVQVPDEPFLIEARLPTPLGSSGFDDFQSAGIHLGPGNQANFLRVAAIANGGSGGVQAVKEVSDSPTTLGTRSVGLASLDWIDLMVRVDPAAQTATAFYAAPGGDPVQVGSPTSIPASWLSNRGGLAVGIIATSRGGDRFGATYEHIEVSLNPDDTVPPPPSSSPPPPSGDGDTFVDDDDSIFEDDIEWLAATGITRGCNPPDNDRFCPEDNVTRGQMAAFFVRALGLSEGAGADLFVDDDGSIFEGDIDRFGTEGITRGCNPPTNDRYCPDDFVTRGQMAAFFHRAASLLGLPG